MFVSTRASTLRAPRSRRSAFLPSACKGRDGTHQEASSAAGCSNRPRCALMGTNISVVCPQHREEGMFDVFRCRRCGSPDCDEPATFGYHHAGSSERIEYTSCRDHAKTRMVSRKSKMCGHPTCCELASFGADGIKAEYCSSHTKEGMLDIHSQVCIRAGCAARSKHGVEGQRARFCMRHAEPGMFDPRACVQDGCTSAPTHGMPGNEVKKFFRRHTTDGMVCLIKNVQTRRKGCSTSSSYGEPGSRSRKF